MAITVPILGAVVVMIGSMESINESFAKFEAPGCDDGFSCAVVEVGRKCGKNTAL